MRFVFLFLGKTKENYLETGIADYCSRLEHYIPCERIILKQKIPANPCDALIRAREGEALLEKSRDASLRVVLDPGGQAVDSPGLARLLRDWRDRGTASVYFLIGGHLGLHPAVLRAADLTLSLSRLTFTHDMSRLLLMEQLYRACTINAGQQYHK